MTYHPDHVEDSEATTRFAFEKGYFRSADNTAKPKAFEPNPDGEVSVFRVDGLGEVEVWTLGDSAGQMRPQPKAAIARLDLLASAIAGCGLRLVIAEPPVRHAAIVGWPDQEDLQIQKAQELARLATLRKRS